MSHVKPLLATALYVACAFTHATGSPSGSYIKDPTAPLNPVVESGPEAAKALSLTAIFQREDASTAVINGERVRIGDRVGNLTVTKITQDAVHLSGHAPVVLSLYPRVTIKRQVEK